MAPRSGSIRQDRDDVLERDDEVAVSHEPADREYRGASEALVNIRATLERAVAAAVIPRAVADALLVIGRELFYPENPACHLEAGP
jgi:hypothetical protein